MKTLILGLIFASISFMGYKVGDRYRQKEKFYYEFKTFLIYLKSEIGFFKKDIVQIVENYQTKNKNLCLLLNNFGEFLNGEKAKNLDILSLEENLNLHKFFEGLGKSDCDSQKEYIEKNLEIFEIVLNDAKQKNQKQGNMLKKLSILVGILVCIILI